MGSDSTDDRLTHFDSSGRARMVDVSQKPATARRAIAEGALSMAPATLERIRAGGVRKGDVLSVAELAGIMAAKRTDELIPLCHSLPLSTARVEFALDTQASRILIRAECASSGQTGVEMEALVAVSLAGLTVYDMCKAMDRAMVLGDVRLVHKSGGKSGTYEAASAFPQASEPEG